MVRKAARSEATVWRDRVDRWRNSGLSQAEFCRREGLAETALSTWKNRLGRKSKAGAPSRAPSEGCLAFAPVQVVSTEVQCEQPAVRPEPVEVLLVRIPHGTSDSAVRQLLNTILWKC